MLWLWGHRTTDGACPIWAPGKVPSHKVRPIKEWGGEGARRKEIMVPLERGKELAWLGWCVGRGEGGPASRTS